MSGVRDHLEITFQN